MKSSRPLTIALGVSLTLNIVLLGLLLVFANRNAEAGASRTGELSESSQGTPAVTVIVATATPDERGATAIAQGGDGETPVAPTAPPLPSLTPEPAATAEPSPPPSPTPALTPTAEPTATKEPTATPEPTATLLPTPTQVVLQGPGWLQYMNQFRLQAGLPLVPENPALSEGSRLHSTYMVKTGEISHQENSGSPFYTAAGQLAAQNGNLAVGFSRAPEYDWAFNYWISAPFHGIPILDPQLATVGFGNFRDVNASVALAATLDIRQGLSEAVPQSVSFPILFPKDGGEAWVLRYSLPEFPDARAHCGYGSVAGAPIMVQIGSGDQVPNVTSSILRDGTSSIEHCIFDETNYFNPNTGPQQVGRSILDQRDAVVMMPRNPLEVGKTYSVELTVNGMLISWSFNTVAPPATP